MAATDKLNKALDSFLHDQGNVNDLGPLLYYLNSHDTAGYDQLRRLACNDLSESLLELWEWKLINPVRSSLCGEWDSRIMMIAPGEVYEMPNISRMLVKNGITSGVWDSKQAIAQLFQIMGEPEWQKIPIIVQDIKSCTIHNIITAIKIKTICARYGLKHKTGTMIAVLKSAGIISPKLMAFDQISRSASPLYECNPCVYPKI